MGVSARQQAGRRVVNRGKASHGARVTLKRKSPAPASAPQGVGSSGKPSVAKEAVGEQGVEVRVLSAEVAAYRAEGASEWSTPDSPDDAATVEHAAVCPSDYSAAPASGPVGLRRLVTILLDPSATVDDGCCACGKIADLCTAGTRRNQLVQDALFAEGAVEALVHVIASTVDERVQQLAVLALGCLCELHPDSQQAARAAGAVRLLFNTIREDNDQTKEVASTTLIHLTDNLTAAEGDLGQMAGIPHLINLIKADAYQQTPTCENCTWVLGNLSCSAAHHEVIREHGGVPALLYLLEKSAASKNYMLEYRVVWSLCNLASNKACQDEIRTCNGIPLLSAQLANSDGNLPKTNSHLRTKVVQIVAHILSNLAVEPLNQQELLDAGVVPILLHLLESCGDSKVTLMSGWALSNMASNPRTHSSIVRSNGPGVFTAVLGKHRQNHWLVLRMVVALGNLACDSPENRETIREVGAIGLLVYCLTDEHADVCERSLIALENLSTNSHANQLEIARAGAIPHLVAVMARKQEGMAVEKAVGTVYNLACAEENVNSIWECGAVPVLEALLAGGDVAVQMRNSARQSLPECPRTELQDRAKLALEKLIPTRGAIVPESTRQGSVPRAAAPTRSLRQRLRDVSAALAKVRLREHWARGMSRLGHTFRQTLARRAWTSSRSTSSGRNGAASSEEVRRATEEALPTWDTSIAGNRYGVGADPDMKVYNVHEMIASYRTPRATHDGVMSIMIPMDPSSGRDAGPAIHK